MASILQTVNETCQSALFELNRHWTGPRKSRIGDSAWSRLEAVDSYYDSLPDFHSTPLSSFRGLASRLGIRQLLVKDESKRLDLKAFKVLGVSYAVNILLKGLADGARLPTLSAATEGNHGRALAWEARRLAMRAVIYIPASAAPARIEAIRSLGAEVVLVDGSYDDAVRRMALQSKKYGYTVVSDTGFEGYLEIPKWISAGYMRIFSESWRDLESRGVPAPDIVFVQGGVGGLAAGAVNFFDQAALDETPALIVVEPTEAACLLSSITSSEGMPRPASGSQQTIAAGLNCALPSLAAWPTVRRGIKACLAVEDNYVEEAVRTLFHPEREDPRIVSGEAGAAGLAGLLALARDANLEPARRKLGLGSESCVLVLVTEGATNPDGFREIVGVDSCNGVNETEIGRVEENQ